MVEKVGQLRPNHDLLALPAAQARRCQTTLRSSSPNVCVHGGVAAEVCAKWDTL